jgi:hypothetical protein
MTTIYIAFSDGKPLRKRPLRFAGMYRGVGTSLVVLPEYVLRIAW